MKKVLSIFLATVSALFFSVSVFAVSIVETQAANSPSPRLVGMVSGNADMSLSNGRVEVWGDITVREGYTGKITATLQKSSNGVSGWTTVETFHSSPFDSTTDTLYGIIYVTSNYEYRTKFQYYCYDKSGKLVDNSTSYVYG